MAIRLINAHIASDAKANTNKYSHGQTVTLNIVLTYRSNEAYTATDKNIVCNYEQIYKDINLNTFVSSNKTANLNVTEPTGDWVFTVPDNDILTIKGTIAVRLENPEFGNTFKFTFTDGMNSTPLPLGNYWTYDIGQNRIVSLHNNKGDEFIPKTDVNAVFRNGVNIRDSIPYNFIYKGTVTHDPVVIKPGYAGEDSETPSSNPYLEFTKGHVVVLDSPESMAVPDRPFIATFFTTRQINYDETITFVFANGQSITKAFLESIFFCNQSLLGHEHLLHFGVDERVKANYAPGTQVWLVVDPCVTYINSINALNSINPINSTCPANEYIIDWHVIAKTDNVVVGGLYLPEFYKYNSYDNYIGNDYTIAGHNYIITQNGPEGNGEETQISLPQTGDMFSFSSGLIQKLNGDIEDTHCLVYYQTKIKHFAVLMSVLDSMFKAYATKEDCLQDKNALTNVEFKAEISCRLKTPDIGVRFNNIV